jgi:hypothetical protein
MRQAQASINSYRELELSGMQADELLLDADLLLDEEPEYADVTLSASDLKVLVSMYQNIAMN